MIIEDTSDQHKRLSKQKGGGEGDGEGDGDGSKNVKFLMLYSRFAGNL